MFRLARIIANMNLIGRDDQVSHLLSSTAKLTMVVGDSGVGKSAVLAAAQLQPGDRIAPATVMLRQSPGALQRALLESLGLAVAEITLDTTAAERVGAAVRRAIERVAEDNLKGIANAVGRHLVGIIRAHVGDAAADALGRVASELTTPDDIALQSRIANSADTDVVVLISRLAAEARDLTDGRSIVLALDNADMLGEDDVRHLADLATHLPDGIFLHIGLSTWSASLRNVADRLREAGSEVVALGGLGTDDVARYLVDAGLPPEHAVTVHAVTNGYPLYLEDAVALLLANGGKVGELSTLKPGDILTARTQQIWRSLDLITQAYAGQLAAFHHPLPSTRIPGYLGIPESVWPALEARLRDNGVFTGQGTLWFHELRRRCLWQDVLTDAQRAVAADQALPFLAQEITAGELRAERLVEYARVVPHSAQMTSDPKIAAVLAISSNGVAVAAAAMELGEPDTNRLAVNAEHCLLHARDAFGATEDLRAALNDLVDRQILVAASNEEAMVIVPVWGSTEAVLTLAGRAAAELGRVPIPAAATRLFEAALRHRVEPFRSGVYGVGSPTVAELSQMAETQQQRHPDGSIHIGGPGGPNLLVRARHGGLPFYAGFAFEDRATRDEAAQRLMGYEEAIFGLPLRCDTVLEHPLTVVPSLRFVAAVERILGRSLTPFPFIAAGGELARAIDIEEEATQRVDFIAAVSALCSREERYAYALEQSFGLLFHEGDDATVLAEVVGGSGARRLSNAPEFRTPFARFQLGLDAGLGASERIGRITGRIGATRTDDPIIDELTRLFERVRRFNQSQRRASFVLTEAGLGPALTVAAERELADAHALRAVVGHGRDLPTLRGQSTCVLLKLDIPQPHLVPGAEAIVMVATAPNDMDRDEVTVRSVHELPSFGNRDEVISVFGSILGDQVHSEQISGWTHGLARGVLARILGHHDSEVAFSYGPDAGTVETP
jgi:hypothetical protein